MMTWKRYTTFTGGNLKSAKNFSQETLAKICSPRYNDKIISFTESNYLKAIVKLQAL